MPHDIICTAGGLGQDRRIVLGANRLLQRLTRKLHLFLHRLVKRLGLWQKAGGGLGCLPGSHQDIGNSTVGGLLLDFCVCGEGFAAYLLDFYRQNLGLVDRGVRFGKLFRHRLRSRTNLIPCFGTRLSNRHHSDFNGLHGIAQTDRGRPMTFLRPLQHGRPIDGFRLGAFRNRKIGLFLDRLGLTLEEFRLRCDRLNLFFKLAQVNISIRPAFPQLEQPIRIRKKRGVFIRNFKHVRGRALGIVPLLSCFRDTSRKLGDQSFDGHASLVDLDLLVARSLDVQKDAVENRGKRRGRHRLLNLVGRRLRGSTGDFHSLKGHGGLPQQ